ncbi:hypothetical protein F0562_012214 [Nyssa sinensis]|uniref:Uncharacterized protein n=1 Tax=Nyssa sinensis TaxID=561372 RepID=A0A5J4ZWQ8_9ASTE|nr:hypothetical protein F0562_012214 [Nyssa sinensis]
MYPDYDFRNGSRQMKTVPCWTPCTRLWMRGSVKLKRVVSFRFYCISNLVTDGFPTDELDYDEDEEIFDGMDILSIPFCKPKIPKFHLVRSQTFRDEENSANMADANLSILKERIEEVRKKERLATGCRLQNGWTYKSGYDSKHKRQAMLSESIELVGLVSTALGFVFLCGSFFIFLVSFIVHMRTW